MPLLDGLAESDVLPIVNEEGVLLVVCDDVVDAGKGQRAHRVVPLRRRVNVEMLATVVISD